MVDKQTARALVYGALALLVVVLLVAVYAIASRSSVQAELDEQLEQLQLRELKLKQERQSRKEAMDKFNMAQEALQRKEEEGRGFQEQRDHYRDEFENVNKEKDSVDKEAHLLRRKLWDKTDQARMEELEGLDEDKLREELESESENFLKEELELENEHSPEDKEDLEQEVLAAKEFRKKYMDADKHLKDAGDEGDERALEDMEELGEQNEVYLDELERDAKKHSKSWKEGSRPSKMNNLVHEMDLHAEALRNKYAERRLQQDSKHLEEIDESAKKHKDDPMASEVNDVADELKLDEQRMLRELEQGDEDEAEEAAEKLEEDAEEDDVKAAKMEQDIEDSTMSEEEKKEHEAMVKELEGEIEKGEHEAELDFRGFERKGVRSDAVRMAKAVNAFAHQEGANKLKHGNAVVKDVSDTLAKEGELLHAMKEGNDMEKEEELGEELGEESDHLEEDASDLHDEAEAGDYDSLDEKLLDEHLAKELEETGGELGHDAEEVDEADRERSVREAGEDMEEQAQHLGKDEAKFGGNHIKERAHELDEEAEQLGRAVGEQAWDEEIELANKAFEGAEKLNEEAENAEKLIEADHSLPKAEHDEDIAALEQMEKDAKQLEEEAQSIKKEVKVKAEHRKESLETKLLESKRAAQKAAQG